MAANEKQNQTVQQTKEAVTTKPVAYPIEYLAENAAAFNTQPEVVIGSLVGKTSATKEEAEAAIKAYLETPNEGHKPAEKEASN